MDDKEYLFRKMPVYRAVLALAIPTVLSQLITLIYNLADTFFIGRLNDPAQVAAATVALPPFIVLTALSNLFGIGGAGKISRCLGSADPEGAGKSASFSVWAAVLVPLAYGLAALAAAPVLLPLLGAGQDTYEYCRSYMFWTVTVGAVPTVLSVTLSHLVRAEGHSRQAGFGVALGGILNIALDPVFIFVFGLEIAGAALATMLSNLFACLYFIGFLRRQRGRTVVTQSLRRCAYSREIACDILLGGLPSFTMMILSCVSNSVLNNLMASWATEAMAGMGIAKKIDMIAFSVAQGMTQGVLPLIAYNYASGDRKRMQRTIGVTLAYALTLACAGMAGLYFFAGALVRCFIGDGLTVVYGQRFVRIICFLCPSTAFNYMVIAVFQATKRRTQSIVLSVLRKGSLDIPLMLLFSSMYGVTMIPWATPISDWLALVVAVCLLVPELKKMQAGPGAGAVDGPRGGVV